LKVYLDTSVIISLADSLDVFHTQSLTFVNSLAKRDIECKVGSPLLVELGGIFKVRGAARCFEVTSTLDRFGIELEVIDMKEVWQLSQLYLDEHALTARHRLDMLHYAAASLIHCTHLAS